jgi:hypothetical protein
VRERHRANNKHRKNKNGLPTRPEEHFRLGYSSLKAKRPRLG